MQRLQLALLQTGPMDHSTQTTLTVLHEILVATCLLVRLYEVRKHTRKRTKRRITKDIKFLRIGILEPYFYTTPCRRLLLCGVDSQFIVATNFNRKTFFGDLLPWFKAARTHTENGSPFHTSATNRGRKPILHTEDLLGLALWYLKSGDVEYSLCPIFGITPSSLSEWLDFALQVLWNVVQDSNHPQFRIEWPNEQQMKESCDLLEKNRLHGYALRGVFGISDGARMDVPSFDDPDLQNAFYNFMTQRVEATNLLVWNFKGEVIHAALNYPGSWHDSKLAYISGLYWPTLIPDCNTPPGYAILGDAAFVNDTRITAGKVVRARKVNERKGLSISTGYAAIDLLLQRIYPSERQSAEWGVRGLKAPFRRLTRVLPSNHHKRGRLLYLACHLVNYRTRTMGHSQIASVYTHNQELDAI